MRKLLLPLILVLNITCAYAHCDKPMLTKSALHGFCKQADSGAVARLITADQDCGKTKFQELAIARRSTSGDGLASLTRLINVMYQKDSGYALIQTSIAGLCWSN